MPIDHMLTILARIRIT